MFVVDLKGAVLAGVGWSDSCMRTVHMSGYPGNAEVLDLAQGDLF